jgi:type IV secretory pathway component VirB8
MNTGRPHRPAPPDAECQAQPQTNPLYETIRLLGSEILETAQRDRRVGLSVGLSGVVLGILAFIFALAVLSRLDRQQYVKFSVETGTGIVRLVETLDGPINPDDRVRAFFITMVVNDFETFNRRDVNERLDRLRWFIPPEKTDLYTRHVEKMQRLLGDTTDREQRATIGPITPVTEHKLGSAINQSLVDVSVEVITPNRREIHELRVTIEYRFLGYGKTDLQTVNPELRQKIRHNPLGMEVVGYRTEVRIPPRLADTRSPS